VCSSDLRTTVSTRGEMHVLSLEIEVVPGADRISTTSALAEMITGKLGLQADITVVEPASLPRFEMKGKRFFIEKQQ